MTTRINPAVVGLREPVDRVEGKIGYMVAQPVKVKETEPFVLQRTRYEHRMIPMGRDGQPRAVMVEYRKRRKSR